MAESWKAKGVKLAGLKVVGFTSVELATAGFTIKEAGLRLAEGQDTAASRRGKYTAALRLPMGAQVWCNNKQGRVTNRGIHVGRHQAHDGVYTVRTTGVEVKYDDGSGMARTQTPLLRAPTGLQWTHPCAAEAEHVNWNQVFVNDERQSTPVYVGWV